MKGIWLAQPVERAALDLRAVSSSPTLGVEPTEQSINNEYLKVVGL